MKTASVIIHPTNEYVYKDRFDPQTKDLFDRIAAYIPTCRDKIFVLGSRKGGSEIYQPIADIVRPENVIPEQTHEGQFLEPKDTLVMEGFTHAKLMGVSNSCENGCVNAVYKLLRSVSGTYVTNENYQDAARDVLGLDEDEFHELFSTSIDCVVLDELTDKNF